MKFSKKYFRPPKLLSLCIGLLKNFRKNIPAHKNSIALPPWRINWSAPKLEIHVRQAVGTVARDPYLCTIKILLRAGMVDEGRFSEKKKCIKGGVGKNLFGRDGTRHENPLKCLGVRSFSKMTVKKSALSASHWLLL